MGWSGTDPLHLFLSLQGKFVLPFRGTPLRRRLERLYRDSRLQRSDQARPNQPGRRRLRAGGPGKRLLGTPEPGERREPVPAAAGVHRDALRGQVHTENLVARQGPDRTDDGLLPERRDSPYDPGEPSGPDTGHHPHSRQIHNVLAQHRHPRDIHRHPLHDCLFLLLEGAQGGSQAGGAVRHLPDHDRLRRVLRPDGDGPRSARDREDHLPAARLAGDRGGIA